MTYLVDILWALGVICSLRTRRTYRGPIAWPVVASVIALTFFGDVLHYRGRHWTEAMFGLAAICLFLWLNFFGGRGFGKKFWNKIAGSRLTQINAASFRRQASEAA